MNADENTVSGKKNDSASDKIVAPPTPSKLGLVLVTGGSRGIGRATSILLAQRGYDVAVNYRSCAKEAQATIDEIKTNNNDSDKMIGQVMTFQADVSSEEQVISLYDSIYAKFGRYPTGLVNNAGILGTREKDITSMTTSNLDEVFAVNVYGPFYCTREFVRRWKESNNDGLKGSIVNVSSGSAHTGNPLFYAMSKGALNSFMAGLSKTLPADHNIRMNAVAPGVTKTDMVTEDMANNVMPLIPMKRVGEPEEIAEGIVFLISDGSSYCSGANIRMSGGRP